MEKFLANNPILYLFRRVWRHSEGNRKKVAAFIVMAISSNIVRLLEPLLLAWILNTIQSNGVNSENVWSLIGLLCLFPVLELINWAFHLPARLLEKENSFLVKVNHRKHMLNGILDLPMSWHAEHHSGDTVDRVEKGSGAIGDFAEGIHIYVNALIKLVGSLIAIAFFDLGATAILVILGVIVVRIVVSIDLRLYEKYTKLNRFQNVIAAKTYDLITNIKTIITLRIERPIFKNVVRHMMAPFKVFKSSIMADEFKWFFVNFSGYLMIPLVIGWYVYSEVSTGAAVMVGTIYALYGYTSQVLYVLEDSAWIYGSAVRMKNSVRNAEEIADKFQALSRPVSKSAHDWKVCTIDNLSFSYHGDKAKGQKARHIDNMSLRIRRGENIAVIGESGSGKTTLLMLMRGLYDPQKVKLSLDGRELSRGFHDMSYDISLIPQDPEIFEASIKENITLGLSISATKLDKYIKQARLKSVIDKLPKGLKSSVVEKGVNLSGGQKQRLALARGLMASDNKSIILLDESTSSVDPENEMLIYESLVEEYKDKTIIASIHKLHLLRFFDRVYLFNDGKIEASGTFDELLKKSKHFATMWQNYNESMEESDRGSAR